MATPDGPTSDTSTSVFPGFSGTPAANAFELMKALVRRRRQQGLSQTQVAARMGTSQSSVARLETGQSDVRVSTLRRYAESVGAEMGFTVHDDTEDGQP